MKHSVLDGRRLPESMIVPRPFYPISELIIESLRSIARRMKPE